MQVWIPELGPSTHIKAGRHGSPPVIPVLRGGDDPEEKLVSWTSCISEFQAHTSIYKHHIYKQKNKQIKPVTLRISNRPVLNQWTTPGIFPHSSNSWHHSNLPGIGTESHKQPSLPTALSPPSQKEHSGHVRPRDNFQLTGRQNPSAWGRLKFHKGTTRHCACSSQARCPTPQIWTASKRHCSGASHLQYGSGSKACELGLLLLSDPLVSSEMEFWKIKWSSHKSTIS